MRQKPEACQRCGSPDDARPAQLELWQPPRDPDLQVRLTQRAVLCRRCRGTDRIVTEPTVSAAGPRFPEACTACGGGLRCPACARLCDCLCGEQRYWTRAALAARAATLLGCRCC